MDKLAQLTQVYNTILEKLNALEDQNHISVYTKKTLVEMSTKVLEHIAKRFQHIKEGVKSVMGGQVLEYEAKTIRNSGISLGFSQGIYNSVINASKKLDISIEEACDIIGITMDEYIEAKKLQNQ